MSLDDEFNTEKKIFEGKNINVNCLKKENEKCESFNHLKRTVPSTINCNDKNCNQNVSEMDDEIRKQVLSRCYGC